MRTDFTFLRQLLQYELHAAERHRRFVSLVMMTSDNALAGVRDFLGVHIRDSDVMANFDHSVAVLMEETDGEGAIKAIDRFKGLFDSQVDLRFSVVTYPRDGGKSDRLIKTGYQRLDEARKAESGAIVDKD